MAKTLGNNIALVLNQFQNQLKYKHSGLKTMHHDNHDFDSIMTSLRTKKLITNDTDRLTECFVYLRTNPLTYPDGGGFRRPSVAFGTKRTGNTIEGFKCVRAEMELSFLYLTSNIAKSDYFEIAYGCEDGITSIKKFQLNLSDHGLGLFDYTCHWNPLETREYAFEETMFKAIGGTCVIQGEFFIVDGDAGSIIEQINYKLYEENMEGDSSRLVESTTIT